MKKITITLFAIGMMVTAHAQNYIGLTKNQIVAKLKVSKLAYEEFVNSANGKTIEVIDGDVSKLYVFAYSLTCNKYYVQSDKYDFVNEYSEKLLKSGYKVINAGNDGIIVELTNGQYYAYFLDHTTSENYNEESDYKYSLCITPKNIRSKK